MVSHLSTAVCTSASEQQDTAVKPQEQQDDGTKQENTDTLELPTVLQAATAKNSFINAFKVASSMPLITYLFFISLFPLFVFYLLPL